MDDPHAGSSSTPAGPWLDNIPWQVEKQGKGVPLPHHRARTASQGRSVPPVIPSASASLRHAASLSRTFDLSATAPNSPSLDSPSRIVRAPIPIPIPIPVNSPHTGNTPGPEGVLSPPTPVPSPRCERQLSEGITGERSRTLSGMDHRRADELRRLMQREEPDADITGLEEGMAGLWENARPDAKQLLGAFRSMPAHERFAFLSDLVPELRMNEALIVSRRIEPFLRRDMLRELPAELALHCMSFINDAATLTRAARVSRYWNALLEDEHTWREMCTRHRFKPIISPINTRASASARKQSYHARQQAVSDRAQVVQNRSVHGAAVPAALPGGSPTFKQQYKNAFLTQANWLHGGRVLKDHISADECVVTTVAMNAQYLIIGMATPVIHVFDTATCTYLHSLEGHQAGVWALNIVTPAPAASRGSRSPPAADDDSAPRMTTSADQRQTFSQSKGASFRHFAHMRSGDPMGEVRGWGTRQTVLVSGGSDRELRVWKVATGQCVFALQGHTSTIRCLRVLDRLPICITGSRDGTLRVWDIHKGQQRHFLSGHTQSVRCLDVAGNLAVSGSYDGTARVWDVVTGRLIHVLTGHFDNIYSVIFQWDSPEGQPARIITGSVDASIRIWDATSGECITHLQGHTALVGQMQVSGNHLVTGGSDGRVILYDLASYECLHRICAHDNSITAIHFDERYIVSASNDGRIKLWDTRSGHFIRELSMPCDGVWRVAVRDDRVYILLSRQGKTVIEFLTFRPEEVL